MSDAVERERLHQEAWYTRAIEQRFFEREGFRRLIDWNLARLRTVVPLTAASRVLSLGCGTGEYELRLAAEVRQVTAVDLSHVAVEHGTKQARARGLANLTFVADALLEANLPEAGFDVVYALGLLHHLSGEERAALLRRVSRWLVPGGSFYARDPNGRGLLRRATSWWFRNSEYHSPNEAALDPVAMCAELRAAGLRDPHVGYTDVLGGPLPWLVTSPSALLWSSVFAFDRAWLAVPGLRGLASQFDVRAAR